MFAATQWTLSFRLVVRRWNVRRCRVGPCAAFRRKYDAIFVVFTWKFACLFGFFVIIQWDGSFYSLIHIIYNKQGFIYIKTFHVGINWILSSNKQALKWKTSTTKRIFTSIYLIHFEITFCTRRLFCDSIWSVKMKLISNSHIAMTTMWAMYKLFDISNFANNNHATIALLIIISQ